jgi:TolB-like protein
VLAVLPVDNGTGDPDAQPLADGMTDALIAQIGALGAARVISRTSAERVAGSGSSFAGIGRELGADTIVQGALQSVSGRIRMDVRVIEAASGTTLWSDNARVWYANMLVSKGGIDEALREIFAARDLDPFSPVVNTNVGWILQFAGRHADAADHLVRTLELAPDYPQAHARLSASFVALQRYDAALSHAQRAVELTGRSPHSLAALASVHAQAGQRDRAEALLHELLDASRTRYVPPFAIASVYRHLGEVEPALDWLERAVEEGSNGIAYLAAERYPEAMRTHHRFQALLERTGRPAPSARVRYGW